jgi:hypothetical protein
MAVNTDKLSSNEAKRKVLQYANDIMHEELTNENIVVVATHNRDDPRTFTVVADSVYDRELEGIKLVFENPDDFKRIFPDLAAPLPVVLAPNMETNNLGVAVPIHKDPYKVRKVYSIPPVENPEENNPDNVLIDDDSVMWSLNKNPAQLLLDLDKDSDLGTLWIEWDQATQRQYKFTIAVASEEQFALEPKEFSVIPELQSVYSNLSVEDAQPYNLVIDPNTFTKARYILINVYGNNQDGWAAIKKVSLTKAVSIKSVETKTPDDKTTLTTTINKAETQGEL